MVPGSGPLDPRFAGRRHRDAGTVPTSAEAVNEFDLAVSDAAFGQLRSTLPPLAGDVEVLFSSPDIRAMSNLFIRSDGVVVTFGGGADQEFIVGDLRTESVREIVDRPAVRTESLLPSLVFASAEGDGRDERARPAQVGVVGQPGGGGGGA